MCDGYLFLCLPSIQELLSADFLEIGSPILFLLKICTFHDTVIDKCYHKTVNEKGTQFFHEIQRERLSSGTGPM